VQHIPKTHGDYPIQDTILGDKQLMFVGQVKPPSSFVICFSDVSHGYKNNARFKDEQYCKFFLKLCTSFHVGGCHWLALWGWVQNRWRLYGPSEHRIEGDSNC
jgi:hypothetical protein